IPACCDDDDNYNSAIAPVLSTEETENSLSMGDEHLDTIPATKSDEVIKSSVENLVPIPSEFEGILDTITTIHSNISLSDYEAFYFDDDHIKEISSGSTTIHSNISLLDYEAFYFDDDHIKEISSGSTTTRYDISLSEYDSFIFDLLKNQFHPTDRSDFTHEEFADELTHIISPPEYDCFYFRNVPDPGDLISILNSRIRENLSTTYVNLPVEDDHSPLFAYVVWIFLAISHILLFHLIFTRSGMKIRSLTQASSLIIFILLSRFYLIGVELSRNSIPTIVT
nr:hypothetical protein [Tanacetum cinerariifolium]